VGNGYGKFVGSTQLIELGEIETPLVLTNTLSVPRAADAILDWTLAQPGNEAVTSVNPIVGETNDGRLNNIRRRILTAKMILEAIETAAGGPVQEGVIGAGTGTVAFGWKGGIGTSSRLLPRRLGGHTVGVLVQSNFGGVLQFLGVPVGKNLGRHYLREAVDRGDADGSIMIVVATDAPLSAHNLARLARRGLAGLARTGASMTSGSGDYAVSFSVAQCVQRTPERRRHASPLVELPNAQVSPLFQAVIEATEEAIYNSLLAATTITGYMGTTIETLPVEQLMPLIQSVLSL
jgi:D-aminopeptidase